MIVSFSGIDSAGKTTQIDKLCAYCDTHRVKYIQKWSKARGTPIVVFLKDLVRKDKGFSEVKKSEYRQNVFQNPRKRKLLFVASMLDLCIYWGIYFRIKNLFCDILICDRYIWDTYVEIKQDFQGINIDNSIWWKLVKVITPTPKISFVFIIPAELSLQRDHQKDADGIENIEKKKAKIDTYLRLVEEGRWTNQMDGTRTREALHDEVLSILNYR